MPDNIPPVALMTITTPHGAPSLAEAAAQLDVAFEDMDAVFGVVPINPERGMYAVQVQAAKLPQPPTGVGKPYRGPWSNPTIMPFGPVQNDKTRDDKADR